jgi:anti-sigma-K factor RskA
MERAALLLPYAVEDTEPGPQVRESLMQRIASEPTVLRPRSGWPVWQRFTAIAAAAAVLIVAGGFAGALLNSGGNGSLEEENSRQGALVQAVAEGNARRQTGQQDGSSAVLVYAPGNNSAFAWVEDLPALPKGKAYQAWFIADGSPKPSNVFSASQGGIWVESPGDVAEFGAFALTIEDEGGAPTPSQEPFIVLNLGTAASRVPFTTADWLALTSRD